ncbi:MAG: InlB B-repeat-containing protein [Alphaproteobacteria bacterium]|nr:InlB B-repeat-containing protein [Alphaproteobacteria bacterium]
MRKLIPIIFIFVCCSNASLAQITCTQLATTNCEPGCYYTETSGCKMCDVGKYTANTGSTSCSNCNKPSVATFTSAGTSVNGCEWQITCKEGTQFISTGDSNSACQTPTSENFFFPNARTITDNGFGTTEGGKYECYTNSYRNKNYTGCICNRGYHLYNMENDDTDTTNVNLLDILDAQNRVICYANDYTITYKSSDDQNAEKETHTVEFNSTVTLKTDKPFTKTGYTLSGWKLAGTNKTYTDKQIITYEFDHDITLIAQWSGKSFQITYDMNNAPVTTCAAPKQPTSCTYGQTCSAPNIPSGCTYNGYLFNGWKCTSGCNDSNTIISPGTDINDISGGNDMTLTAQWAECPAGYYCPDISTDNECPAGSTSDDGSDQIDDCHMTGGTTQICDKNNKCFKLPAAVGNIFYHGTQQ